VVIGLAKAGYEDLEVYRRSFAMQKPVHQLVLRFPDYEKFDLANQMRRASKSVSANIAEGYARRRSPKEFCGFLAVAVGSANEMEVHLKTAFELGYVSQAEFEHFIAEYNIIGKQLTRLIQYWRTREGPVSRSQ
jgi:four helix bundle protein